MQNVFSIFAFFTGLSSFFGACFLTGATGSSSSSPNRSISSSSFFSGFLPFAPLSCLSPPFLVFLQSASVNLNSCVFALSAIKYFLSASV